MSWQLRSFEVALRVYAKVQGDAGTAAGMQKAIDKARAKPKLSAPSARAQRGLDVSNESVDGITVWQLKPTGASPTKHVLYLHGGSYTFEISPFHWNFLNHIVPTAGVQATVPIYTLAPEAGAETTIPAMTDILERMVDEHGAENVTVMGDSAGGGMALAVAQALRDRGKQPAHIVLISPWLDVTMSESKAKEIEPHDMMLRVDSLRHAGLCYAGPLDPKDPRVSPLFGDMKGLAPIDLFIGTYDVFYADIPPMKAAVEKGGGVLHVHEAAKMPHVYPILPIPENRESRAVIVGLVGG